MVARDFRLRGRFSRRRERERGKSEEKKMGKEGENSLTFFRRCSVTVKILFLADNAETRPNEIAIAPANVCIIKK